MVNGTILQFFHWYYPSDGSLWKLLKKEAPRLLELGITAVWLPPAFKGTEGEKSVGYDLYDLYDLGEFDQKGSISTKYGTKKEYVEALQFVRELGLQVYVDVVLNHLGGAEETEKVLVYKVNPENRTEFIGKPLEIEAYTKFTYPARKGKYSKFTWDQSCFTGVDYDEKTKEMGVYSILNEYGPLWEEMIDDEKGNYDYLMYSDIEYRNPSVKKEIKKWSKWYYETAAFDGVRLDAVKHINPQFYSEWLDHMRLEINPNLFAVGEYWAPGNIPLLLKYIEATGERMSLFDASLHHNLYTASKTGRKYDLTQIFNECLVSVKPHLAVTIVANHDTQPLQTLEAPIDDWFKPLAYALTLLREAGYPCVFYPDLYGATYLDENEPEGDPIILKKVPELKNLLLARKRYAHGPQKDYFDFPSCIGWTREGVNELENSGCAVIISNGNEGFKNMEVGKQHAGKTFVDLLKKHPAEVMINEDGWGEFFVRAASVSVWVCKS